MWARRFGHTDQSQDDQSPPISLFCWWVNGKTTRGSPRPLGWSTWLYTDVWSLGPPSHSLSPRRLSEQPTLQVWSGGHSSVGPGETLRGKSPRLLSTKDSELRLYF